MAVPLGALDSGRGSRPALGRLVSRVQARNAWRRSRDARGAHQEGRAGLAQADHAAGGVQVALHALRHQAHGLLEARPAVPHACGGPPPPASPRRPCWGPGQRVWRKRTRCPDGLTGAPAAMHVRTTQTRRVSTSVAVRPAAAPGMCSAPAAQSTGQQRACHPEYNAEWNRTGSDTRRRRTLLQRNKACGIHVARHERAQQDRARAAAVRRHVRRAQRHIRLCGHAELPLVPCRARGLRFNRMGQG